MRAKIGREDSEKRDRSAAIIPGAESTTAPGAAPAAAAGADAGGGLAGALAVVLSQRKKKVSGSGKFEVLLVNLRLS